MTVRSLALTDVLLIEPQVFADDRGSFFESYSVRDFADAAGNCPQFVQDNQSSSHKGVLRGLHYQLPPYIQGKLVRVVQGAAFDVAVDLRKSSPTFGQWVGAVLTAANRYQLWVPPGFAHGFLALDDHTALLYKTTAFYDKESERAIRWDDPTLKIAWPFRDVILSPKDADAALFVQADAFA